MTAHRRIRDVAHSSDLKLYPELEVRKAVDEEVHLGFPGDTLNLEEVTLVQVDRCGINIGIH